MIAAFFFFDLNRHFSLEYFKTEQGAINDFYTANPLATAAIYFAIYAHRPKRLLQWVERRHAWMQG